MKNCRSITLLYCICFSVCAVAQVPQTDRFSEETETRANQLREKLKAEIASLQDHPWAGEYYEGDGLGVNVSFIVAPANGYLFEWHGCLGLYDRNFGEVKYADGLLTLTCAFPNETAGFQGIAQQFVSISWGKRVYLVPPEQLEAFFKDVRRGMEPGKYIHGLYLLRDADKKKTLEGLPIVDPAYFEGLRPKPIRATVVAVNADTPAFIDYNKWSIKYKKVRLDKGRQNGVLPGMLLTVIKPSGTGEQVVVTQVEKRSCVGLAENPAKDGLAPEVGWIVRTQYAEEEQE